MSKQINEATGELFDPEVNSKNFFFFKMSIDYFYANIYTERL